MRMPSELVLAVLLLATVAIPAYGTDSSAYIRDEIKRHVVEECTLKRDYGKNRIDFSALEVKTKIIPEMYRKHGPAIRSLVQEIFPVVAYIQSFYKRAKIYDIYYSVCMNEMNPLSADDEIMRILGLTLDGSIEREDRIVHSKLTSADKNDKIARDESRIRLLLLANVNTPENRITRKNSSVIQEYKYDIELWKF